MLLQTDSTREMTCEPTPSPVTERVFDARGNPEKFPVPTAKHPGGAPSTYTLELGEQVCLRLSEGENILDICADDGMPAWSTICGWKIRHPEFAAQYARAREASAELFEARAIRRSANATAEDALAARLEVDTLKWAAAKRQPRVYADTQTHKHEGDVVHWTPEARRAEIDRLWAKRAQPLTIEAEAEPEAE